MTPASKGPRVLFDIDVIFDVLARRTPFFTDSSGVLAACEQGLCRGFVAGHTVPTLAYLLAKHADHAVVRRKLADVLRIMEVAPVDQTVIEAALASDFKELEDAVQMATAMAVGADYLATRNLRDFAAGPVLALAPADLLPLLSSAAG
jgi:predicted nucleic acid-binding protein